DGFNIGQTVIPDTLSEFIHDVVPELQNRGIYRKDYESSTLREHLFGKGQTTLKECHYGKSVTIQQQEQLEEVERMEAFLIQNQRQKEIVEKIQQYIPILQERERSSEQLGSFSFDNVNDLKKIGYTKLPLEDLSTYELVLFQENIARG